MKLLLSYCIMLYDIRIKIIVAIYTYILCDTYMYKDCPEISVYYLNRCLQIFGLWSLFSRTVASVKVAASMDAHEHNDKRSGIVDFLITRIPEVIYLNYSSHLPIIHVVLTLLVLG